MELGDHTTTQRTAERPPVEVALDETEAALLKTIGLLEAGGLDQLTAGEKVGWWQRFETCRNKLPLIDHSLIADAEINGLPGTYCTPHHRPHHPYQAVCTSTIPSTSVAKCSPGQS
jgi:hypothetical protein